MRIVVASAARRGGCSFARAGAGQGLAFRYRARLARDLLSGVR